MTSDTNIISVFLHFDPTYKEAALSDADCLTYCEELIDLVDDLSDRAPDAEKFPDDYCLHVKRGCGTFYLMTETTPQKIYYFIYDIVSNELLLTMLRSYVASGLLECGLFFSMVDINNSNITSMIDKDGRMHPPIGFGLIDEALERLTDASL